MKAAYPIPSSITEAELQFTGDDTVELMQLPNADFMARWSAIAYLEPGLHPDGYESEDSGWPENLKPYAAEAWRRSDLGELNAEEIYCSDAAWAGLYDRMSSHTAEEAERRQRITLE